VACGLDTPEGFNPVAKAAAIWTRHMLTPEHRAWLATLPQGPHIVDDLVEICHGSPFDEDAYIFDDIDAVHALKAARRPLLLFGHTHHPVVFEQSRNVVDSLELPSEAETVIPLRPDVTYLVNPGAVGQARDGDTRAAYAIVDGEQRHVELFRLPYPVARTQAKVRAAGLPEPLAARLAVGR
jgi:diadenosine tetraphosphatase ApaH/serine/threonine PP2A family protein phosphatase